jgi:hypothetical protein
MLTKDATEATRRAFEQLSTEDQEIINTMADDLRDLLRARCLSNRVSTNTCKEILAAIGQAMNEADI